MADSERAATGEVQRLARAPATIAALLQFANGVALVAEGAMKGHQVAAMTRAISEDQRGPFSSVKTNIGKIYENRKEVATILTTFPRVIRYPQI